ncbi:PLDc N-terminal domain-containing protein [Leucobacter sp. CSA2]|uniref:PLDc N-terminal domain-containing protein n=1 Tax=Leucobacter edaphi TaxID=2796472 RepID=A0A934QD96_9MICO|nr:PLDc N-terminal domain-containing protein [Leucobacter edaphi]MBK0422490.1 PLDc N-terminal domain-containing protein [Leucobacter edaphi]
MSSSPEFPLAYDLVFAAIALLGLALLITALVFLVRKRERYTGMEFALWLVVLLAFPFVASAIFLVLRRREGAPVRGAAARGDG